MMDMLERRDQKRCKLRSTRNILICRSGFCNMDRSSETLFKFSAKLIHLSADTDKFDVME